MDRILISACLLGRPVRWNGKGKPVTHPALERWAAEGRLVPVCPEREAGYPVPRPAAEIRDGDGADVLRGSAKVVESTGADASEPFIRGAERDLTIATEQHCRYAILTDGSPSCASLSVYDGSFSGARRSGIGVTAALLKRHGIAVFAETEIDDLADRIDAAS